MSLIKENKFIFALGSGTLVLAALLYLVGARGAANYQLAMEEFVQATEVAVASEKADLYPSVENLNGKTKAIDEYRKSVEGIQAVFEGFRSKEFKNITPQEFQTKLVATNAEIRKAFEESETKIPEAFFVGFEGYTKGKLAPPNTTGVLDYELDSIKKILLALAKAKPSELKNLHRPPVAEEELQTYTPPENVASRPFPLEITFVGSERSAREFISSITMPVSPYCEIRCLRITNEKKDPPRAADAKFDKPAAVKPADNPFGEAFPGPEIPEAGAPAPKPEDSSRILSQVLGNEQIRVFLRIDIIEFLTAKKLP